MKGYADSLRGYGHETHIRFNFTCQYCGFDGRAFPNWLQLTVDHIIPKKQGGTDDPENLATACQVCNSILSRMRFPADMSREEIFAEKKKRARLRQSKYFEFWREHVAPTYLASWGHDSPKQD